jgi:hypothetical protein
MKLVKSCTTIGRGTLLSNGECLALCRRVGLGSLSEGGRLWTVGSIDIRGDSCGDNSVIPARSPSLSSGNESEDWEDRLKGLHVDRLGTIVCFWNESGLMRLGLN